MEEKNILLHLGYPKTGTSFLQERFFQKFNNIFYNVPKPEIRKYFISPWAFGFESQKAEELCSKYLGTKKDVVVFSSEDLSGFPHYHDFASKNIADRLYHCLPTAKILIVIREQRSMLKSSYFQYLKNEGSYNLDQYFMPPGIKNFSRDSLKYHYLIEYYQKLFGSNKVLVLPYELFRDNPQEFMSKICTHISLEPNEIIGQMNFSEKVNEGYPPALLGLKRYFNPFILKEYPNSGKTFYVRPIHALWYLSKRFWKIMPSAVDRKFEKKIKRKIEISAQNRYKESNRLTSILIGIDLAKYGYDV